MVSGWLSGRAKVSLKGSALVNRVDLDKGSESEHPMKKDSELFKPLLLKAERYLRAYCDGKQADDERAKVALRVLSLYRRIIRAEKEREVIRSEWKTLIANVAHWKKGAMEDREKRKSPRRKSSKNREKVEGLNLFSTA